VDLNAVEPVLLKSNGEKVLGDSIVALNGVSLKRLQESTTFTVEIELLLKLFYGRN
jgi:hypothetical protein